MIVKKTFTKSKQLDIKGATLLSSDEAASLLTEEERCYGPTWWLRTPGSLSSWACRVLAGGDVECVGNYVDDRLVGVRPALIINRIKSSGWKVGDIFEFGGKEFKILSPKLAWMYKDDIGHCAFRKNFKADDANDYEASDIKKFVDNWFEVASSDTIEPSLF